MKKTLFSLLASTLMASTTLNAQNANVQIIHNSADTLARSVDIWVNGAKAFSNVAFRSATPFTPLPVNNAYNVGIAPAGSSMVTDTVKNFYFPANALNADSNYVVIASGVLASGYAANPNGVSTAFGLNIIANAKTAAPSGQVSFSVVHGSTDAPSVDVYERNLGAKLIPGLTYSQSTPYITVPASLYDLYLTQKDSAAELVGYIADLSALGGNGAVVLASGFLTPSANKGGAAFGLWAALPSGGALVQLPVRRAANVQVIHNSAAPAADTVDVYVNGAKAIDNFAFRTATPFIKITSNYPTKIVIAPKNSTSIADSVVPSVTLQLEADSNYILTAVGVVGTGFATNPNFLNTGFQLLPKTGVRLTPVTTNNLEFFIQHGCTDAPAVTISVRNPAITLVSGAEYTAQTGYFSVPTTTNYIVDVTLTASSTLYKSYDVPATLIPAPGATAAVIASGFVTPSANNNGKSFGILAVFANGFVLPLTEHVNTGINDLSTGAMQLSVVPNPVNDKMNLNFNLEEKANVNISIVDMSGRTISTIADENMSAGDHQISANVADLNSGVYLVKVMANNKLSVARFVMN